MKKQIIYLLLPLLLLALGCDSDDSPTISSGNLTLNFTHSWNDQVVELSDFNQIKYTSANDDNISISKLRYLISNIKLHKNDGTYLTLNGYFLVDVNDQNLSVLIPNIPFDNYSSVSFVFGFNEDDNIDGAYQDLNSVSWNWPEMLGGGYHFMQFEGKFDNAGTESPFAYHMGTARVNDGVFEQNYFETEIEGFEFLNSKEIDINMDISQWFENPITWDLSIYNTALMPNYDAQKMMQANGSSVFSLNEK